MVRNGRKAFFKNTQHFPMPDYPFKGVFRHWGVQKKCFGPYYNRLNRRARLAGVAKWLSAWPTTRMLEGSIPSRTMKFLLFLFLHCCWFVMFLAIVYLARGVYFLSTNCVSLTLSGEIWSYRFLFPAPFPHHKRVRFLSEITGLSQISCDFDHFFSFSLRNLCRA